MLAVLDPQLLFVPHLVPCSLHCASTGTWHGELMAFIQKPSEEAQILLLVPLLSPGQLSSLCQCLCSESRGEVDGSFLQGRQVLPLPRAKSRRASLAKHHRCGEVAPLGFAPLPKSQHHPFLGAWMKQLMPASRGLSREEDSRVPALRQPSRAEGTTHTHTGLWAGCKVKHIQQLRCAPAFTGLSEETN